MEFARTNRRRKGWLRKMLAIDEDAAPAAFVGGGADINLTDHPALRGEYDGFVYDPPT